MEIKEKILKIKILVRSIYFKLLLCFKRSARGIYYVNGPETLPPPLSKNEEARVIERIEFDDGARQMLIEHNLRLVAHVAKKYASSAMQHQLYKIVSIDDKGNIQLQDERKSVE